MCGSFGRKAAFLPVDIHSRRIKYLWFRAELDRGGEENVDMREITASNGLF